MKKTHIFITGTSKGIGYALVNTLLEDFSSLKIYGFSRNNTIDHPDYLHQNTDLSDPSFINAVEFNVKSISNDDKVVLVNNAGIIEPIKRVGHANENEIITHLNTNLMAPVLLINKFLRTFESHIGEKVILNISSGAARKPIDGWSIYCTGKAGLEMFSKTVELENTIHNSGFKIFSISPGIIDTHMQNKIRSSEPDEFTLKSEFVRYKKDQLLKDPFETSKQLSDVIINTEMYSETLIAF